MDIFRRTLLCACALALCAGPARAGFISIDTGLSAADLLIGALILPFGYAFSQGPTGYPSYPYESGDGYGAGQRPTATELKFSRRSLPGGQRTIKPSLRMRGQNRLGWDAAWERFDHGLLSSAQRTNLYSGHMTALWHQAPTSLLEFGMGAVSLQNEGSRWGPSAMFSLDLFPAKPWGVFLRYQGSRLRGGIPFHDLSAEAALLVGPLGFGAGWRTTRGTLGRVEGLELALHGWF